ncbi:MAG: uridylate kinase [Alphaproteobacteria bacterium]
MTRARVIDELASSIARVSLGRPVRVAIDGRLGSGKTILADELGTCLSARGRPVIRTSIDGFHKPKAERYARGRTSPEGYYYDSRDLAAVVELLLAPLSPGGDCRYRTASFDLESDRPIDQDASLAPADAILIVDGTFLQRPELGGGFDVTIYVATADEIATARGIARDAEQLGGLDAARELYAARYRPAFDLYERLCTPEARADAVFNNDDLERPRLIIRLDGRFGPRHDPNKGVT